MISGGEITAMKELGRSVMGHSPLSVTRVRFAIGFATSASVTTPRVDAALDAAAAALDAAAAALDATAAAGRFTAVDCRSDNALRCRQT